MLTDLASVQQLLQPLFPVPLTQFEPLTPGWHCHALAFQAQEHALVFKMSRQAEVLQAEMTARTQWASLLPVPAVYFSGKQGAWSWIVQARCGGESLSENVDQMRLQHLLTAMVKLHRQRGDVHDKTPVHWVQHLQHLHGFSAHELKAKKPQEGLSPACWQGYQQRLVQDLAVYQRKDLTTAAILGAIHGDLKPAHVFFQGNTLTGVIDWEMQRVGDFLYDWATLLLFASPELPAEDLLMWIHRTYAREGFALHYWLQRLRACLLHTGLGALFMWSQSYCLNAYRERKQRLDALLCLIEDVASSESQHTGP